MDSLCALACLVCAVIDHDYVHKPGWQELALSRRLIRRAELIGRLGSGPQAPLANALLANRLARRVVTYTFGIDQTVPLPAFARTSFRSWFARRFCNDQIVQARVQRARHIVYFYGCTTNYYEPWVGKAAVEVLERNGFAVIVPRQHCCSLPLLASGEIDAARRQYQRNIASLLPYARRGVPIVATSPGCTLALKEAASDLLDMHNADTRLVAEHTYDIFEFLRLLHEHNELDTRFQTIESTLPYVAPHQVHAQQMGCPALDVLGLVPGLHLQEGNHDSCSIAGRYHLNSTQEHAQDAHHVSVSPDLVEVVRRSQSNLLLCDSALCRWLLTHTTGVPGQHPIELLRRAYGS